MTGSYGFPKMGINGCGHHRITAMYVRREWSCTANWPTKSETFNSTYRATTAGLNPEPVKNATKMTVHT